jgi:hypothetical protein
MYQRTEIISNRLDRRKHIANRSIRRTATRLYFRIRPEEYADTFKVKAYTIGNTPEWHPGAGRPANM